MNWSLTILIANILSTWFLVGLIWTIQVVHYPLFDAIGEQGYVSYQQRHQNNITFIVGPMMLIELATSIFLIWNRVEGIQIPLVYVGVGLVALIWISTAILQVPCHTKLSSGFDAQAYKFLVNSNWIRTIAWTARGAVTTWMLVTILPKQV